MMLMSCGSRRALAEFWLARTAERCRQNFARYVRAEHSPGVILLREAILIAAVIEVLVLIWSASEAEEWIDRLVWIPL
jgi:hypothetical protein